MCGIFCRRSSILVDEPDSFISFHNIPDNSYSCQPGSNLSLEGEGIYSLKTSNCKYTVFQQTEQTGDFDATTDGPDSSEWTDEIAGQARNDGIGHPGPDPGSNSFVCTDETGLVRRDEQGTGSVHDEQGQVISRRVCSPAP